MPRTIANSGAHDAAGTIAGLYVTPTTFHGYVRSPAGTFTQIDVPGAGEAVWDEHGARCLGATRITGTQVGCVLPSCAGYSLDDGEWQTQVAP